MADITGMRPVLSALVAFSLIQLPASTFAGSIGHDLSVDLPPGWIVASDTLALPVHIINDGANAQLSVFRSEFSSESAVKNQTELKGSVQKVIDEVILTLPSAKLLTSSGFDQTYRAGFTLEFTSEDTSAHVDLRHRFEGMFYRLPDHRQVLFTLWAKVPRDDYPAADSAIRAIQSSFEYRGPQEATVFPPKLNPLVLVAMIVILGIGLLFFMRTRENKNKPHAHDMLAESPQHGPRMPTSY